MTDSRRRPSAAAINRYRVFARHYALRNNAAEAARFAGYSAKTAGSQGHDLLKLPEVQELVAEECTALSAQAEQLADAPRLLLEASRLAFSSLASLFDSDGRLLGPSAWSPDVKGTVASFEVVSRERPGSVPAEVLYVTKARQHPKVPALELMARLLGLLTNGKAEDSTRNLDLDNLTNEELAQLHDLLDKCRSRQVGGRLPDSRWSK
jgi:phage terminase small subunit